MTAIINACVYLLFATAFAGSYLLDSSPNLRTFFISLTAASLVVSSIVAIDWYYAMLSLKIDKYSTRERIRGELIKERMWLQLFVPRAEHFPPLQDEVVNANCLIAKVFLIPMLFGILVLAISMFYTVAFYEDANRGVFGALLNSKIGRSVAIAFSVYAVVSALSAVLFGLIGKFFVWRSK